MNKLYLKPCRIGNNTISKRPQEPSAALEIVDDNGGLLISRFSTIDRDNKIINPATGLVIYNTNLNKFQQYNGISWETLLSDSNSNIAFTYYIRSTLHASFGGSQPVGFLPPRAQVTRVTLEVTVPWDVAATVTIGDIIDQDKLLAASDNDLETIGMYSSNSIQNFLLPYGAVSFFNNFAGATQGEATVTIYYILA